MSEVTVSYTQRFFTLLELLMKESDEDHRLQQTALAERLESKYHIPIDRRSVKKALDEMRRAGYPVVNERGWYYRHLFSPTELNYLAYSIRCNNTLPPDQQEQLLRKLAGMGGDWYAMPEPAAGCRTANEHFLEILQVLDSAIAEGTQVEFHYGSYDVDLRLHPRLNRSGKEKLYIINPYQIATANGRYYLIANVQKYDGLSHYRVDRILDIRKRKKKAKPLDALPDPGALPDLSRYLTEHPYMYSGPVNEYRFRVKRSGINDVVDWFGKDIRFENTDEKETDVLVRSDAESLRLWHMRYG